MDTIKGNTRKLQRGMMSGIPFQIDTYEKDMRFIECMRFHNAYERITGILEYYPELRNETHERFANLIGFARETVTKTLSKLNG